MAQKMAQPKRKITDNPAALKGFEKLSEREQRYFRVMYSKSGVLFITSPPGIAKSAVARSIARKLGMQYFDIRLSMVDETDVGLFPVVDTVTIEDFDSIDGFGKGMISSVDPNQKKTVQVKTLKHVVPEWAIKANMKPTLIHFEELNRSTLQVRNAALQLLLEREIGAFFKFNDSVFMMSSGNLGEEDGTDVEEFDQALNNRLIHYTHDMPFPEWKKEFADENVHPVVVGFLRANAQYYYKKPDERTQNNKAYATPRSWTFLSDYIFANYGEWEEKLDMDSNVVKDEKGNSVMIRRFPHPNVWLNDIQHIGHSFVGAPNARFLRYVQDTLKISLIDVLDRFDEIEDDIKEFTRDKKSELLTNMKEKKVADLKSHQVDNLVKFLMTVSDDEVVGYVLHVLDMEYNLSDNTKPNKMSEKFLADKRFERFRATIYGHVDDDKNKKK